MVQCDYVFGARKAKKVFEQQYFIVSEMTNSEFETIKAIEPHSINWIVIMDAIAYIFVWSLYTVCGFN